ncbi:MAG: hypothetical protein IMF01_09420 [Proteobacteria bacterium]|nr:hypothetical protein [Pseudomonadota bacterium]
MQGINKLFLKMMKEKKAIFVATKLGHTNTKIVDRWESEKNVPDSRRWAIYEILKQEGYIEP